MMISTRQLFLATLLLLAVVLAVGTGCGTATHPAEPISADDALAPLPLATALDRDGAFSEVMTASAWITPYRGGTVTLDFFTIVVPPFAVHANTLITIERDDPRLATVELGPDGMHFDRPVTLRIDLDRFAQYMADQDLVASDLTIAVYDEDLCRWVALETFVGDRDDVAFVNPFTTPSPVPMGALDDDDGGEVVWALTPHFSRYALSD